MRLHFRFAVFALVVISGLAHHEQASAQSYEWRSRRRASTDITLTVEGAQGISVRTRQQVIASVSGENINARTAGPIAFVGVLGEQTPLAFAREQRGLNGMIDVARGVRPTEVRAPDAQNVIASVQFGDGIEIRGLRFPARLLSFAAPDAPAPSGSWDTTRATRSAQVQINVEDFELCDTPRCGARVMVHQATRFIFKRIGARNGRVRVELVTEDGSLRGWVPEEIVTAALETDRIGEPFGVGGLGLRGTGRGGGSGMTSTYYAGVARLPAGSRVYLTTSRGTVAWAEVTEQVECEVSGDTTQPYFDVIELPNIELVDHAPDSPLSGAYAGHGSVHVTVRTSDLVIPPRPSAS